MKRIVAQLVGVILLLVPTLVNASSATLSVSSTKKIVTAGEQFTLTVRAASVDQPINAISGTLVLPVGVVRVGSITTTGSALNFWIREPKVVGNTIPFEGIILSPGYQGAHAVVFSVTLTATRSGAATFRLSEGAILAHDGKGTNVLGTLSGAMVRITSSDSQPVDQPESETVTYIPSPETPKRLPALPVVTEYSDAVAPGAELFIRGKGEPQAITKLTFQDMAARSLGERFINMLQTKRYRLSDVFIKNDETGNFEYHTPKSLLAGSYNAMPFLVDAESGTEKPGLGAKIFVSDSPMVGFLIVLLNVLALLVPVVGLIVLIYFIPWYSWRRMRVLRRRLGLEEEKLIVSEHQLEREDRLREKITNMPEQLGK
ncbi:MAG TPA: hypothetical protein VLB02_02715 [Candidatus Paceibacterota bacterium]|nr:hypothetical protein [Candidatus Paceibacterota bacterium]